MSNFEENYQKKHRRISLWKSWIRIVSCLSVLFVVPQYVNPNTTLDSKFLVPAIMLVVFAAGMFIAEVLGIMEENI